MNKHQPASKIIAIGSGKGGVGKSLISANLAVQLAMMKANIIVIDADFGGSNLHTYMGLPAPTLSLSHIFSGSARSLGDIMIPTPFPNLNLISADSDIISITNFKYTQKMKVLNEILNLKADFIIIDLGAGSTFNVIDFFMLSYFPLVVATPELASFENAYTFIKNTIFRMVLNEIPKNNIYYQTVLNYFMFPSQYGTYTIDAILDRIRPENSELTVKIERRLEQFVPNLILNRVIEMNEMRLGEKIRQIVRRYLRVDLHFLTYFEEDRVLKQKMTYERAAIQEIPTCSFARKTRELANAILSLKE